MLEGLIAVDAVAAVVVEAGDVGRRWRKPNKDGAADTASSTCSIFRGVSTDGICGTELECRALAPQAVA